MRENGDYDFEITDENAIKIDNAEYTFFIVEEEKLIVAFEEASDGPRMEFIKAN